MVGDPTICADSSVHKWKLFINTTCPQPLNLFVIQTNKKQHLDTFCIQMKKNALSDVNNVFDILFGSVPLINQTTNRKNP